MHGHSKDYLIVKSIIEELNFKTLLLKEDSSTEVIFQKIRDKIWEEIDCVIIIMTKDDEMMDGKKRARQNVVFELGYCFGAWDSRPDHYKYLAKDAILLLTENDVELFANIHGISYIGYNSGQLQEKKDIIKKALLDRFYKAKADWEKGRY